MRASDKAYQILHQDIVQWRLGPGTVLGEVDLSARLGVSRTPIREALSRLTAEGLTTAKGGRGVVVTDISVQDVRDLYDLRETLETKAARLAAEFGNPEIFAALAEQFTASAPHITAKNTEGYYELSAALDAALDSECGNPLLATTLKNLRPQLARVRRMAQENPARLIQTTAEHASICTAVARGNPDLAAATTTVHLNNSLQHILNNLKERP